MTLTKAAKARRRVQRQSEEAASICRSKIPINGRALAEIVATKHLTVHPDCTRCLDHGQVIAPYQCPTDRRHWHIGHSDLWRPGTRRA